MWILRATEELKWFVTRTRSATGRCFTAREGGQESPCADTCPTPVFVPGPARHYCASVTFLLRLRMVSQEMLIIREHLSLFPVHDLIRSLFYRMILLLVFLFFLVFMPSDTNCKLCSPKERKKRNLFCPILSPPEQQERNKLNRTKQLY